MSNPPPARFPRIMQFPEITLPYIEPQNLPPHEQAWIEARELKERSRSVAQRAHQALREWITENKRFPAVQIDEQDAAATWEGETQTWKNYLNDFPEAAVAVYLSWKSGWHKEEITAVAVRDARAAYTLAIKDPAANIEKLQDAMEGDPQMAYLFVKNVTNANPDVALYQTEKFPYWNYQILTQVVKDPEKARNDLRLKIPYSPEAASTWLRLYPDNDEEKKICLRTLQTDSFWAYMTAYAKMDNWKKAATPDDDLFDEDVAYTWKMLRDSALRTPQWAYHWWRDIEPENAHTSLDTVAYHPGWAAQTISDVSQPRGKSTKVEMLIVIDGMIRNIFPQDDPYYTTFIFWGADLVSETPDGKAAPTTDGAGEDDEDESTP